MSNRALNYLIISAAVFAAGLFAQDGRKIEIGFEQRVRNENWNNILDWNANTDDQRNQIRWRTRLWTTIPVSNRVTVSAGLLQETNQIVVPRGPWRFDEVAFERAYIDVKDLFVKGLSLRVGRQDITRGEGTMFFEATPWDGSRSIYSNAAVLGYSRGKTKVELMGILNPSRDRFLPQFHDQRRLLVEWDEQALGAYVTHAPSKKTDVETYWFLKKEIRDTRPAANPQFRPDRHLQYAGALARRRFAEGWSVVGEAAIQRGADHAARKITGWAANGMARKTWTGTRAAPYITAGYWVFSGDDPGTGIASRAGTRRSRAGRNGANSTSTASFGRKASRSGPIPGCRRWRRRSSRGSRRRGGSPGITWTRFIPSGEARRFSARERTAARCCKPAWTSR